MKSKIYYILCMVLSGVLVSCGGYRSTASSSAPIALSIPLILNDEDGILRAEVAKLLAASGKYHYRSSGKSRYQLSIQIKGDKTENVGYVWDQGKNKNETPKRLYPSEGRRMMTASVTVKDRDTGKNLCDPFSVSSFTDYDYVNPTARENIEFVDAEGETRSVLQYSLGQLDSEEGAKNESFHPLLKDIAAKIVAVLVRLELAQ